jgi:hypothetical protein
VDRVGAAFTRLRDLLRTLAPALDSAQDRSAAAHWRPLRGAEPLRFGRDEAYGLAVETAKESLGPSTPDGPA